MKLATKGMLSIAAMTAATSMLALTGISPANAFQFKLTNGTAPNGFEFHPAGGATVINFGDDPTTGSISSGTFGALDFSGTNTSIGSDGDGDGGFLKLGSKNPSPKGTTGVGTFTINVADTTLPYLGLSWTKFKKADLLKLGLKDGTFKSFSGQDILNEVKNDPLITDVDYYLNFYESNVAKRFVSLTITSTGGQVDNLAYRVPTPALLPGLIGLGVAALRKRKQAEQAEAEA